MIARALTGPTASALQAERRRALGFAFAIAGATLFLLGPALWNGFPFLFYDSGMFIELAVKGGFRPERSAFYASFLAAFWPRFSLWPAMVAQVLMTVLVIAAFARILLPGLSPGRFFLLILALGLCTELPWEAAEVLPDILAPLMVLCLYLLGFHSAGLRWPGKVALVAVAMLGATSHASHLGLAAGLAALVALAQVATRRVPLAPARPRWRLPALVFALSLISLVASNFAHTGEVFVTRSGPAFVLGRLIQDGIAKRLLDDTCPQSGYRLCAYKDNLPADSNDFLWGGESPFQKLGGFEGMADEARSITADSLRRYPWLHLKAAVSDTVAQFVTFDTGDGIEPLNGTPIPAMERSTPGQVESYEASRESNDRIAFRWINAFQVPLGALSLVALSAILGWAALRRNWGIASSLPLFLLVALVGNAFICGALSSPHDRYQSRLMWAAGLGVLVLVARPSPRRTPQSSP